MKIECYEGSSGQWSWLLKSGNNQVICRSDDSYVNQEKVVKAAEGFSRKLVDDVELVVLPLTPPSEG